MSEDFGLKSISTENTASGCVKKRSTDRATIKEGSSCELCGIDPALLTIKRIWHNPSVIIHTTSLLYSDFFSSMFPLCTFESLHIFTERKTATPNEAHMHKAKINTSTTCKGRRAGDSKLYVDSSPSLDKLSARTNIIRNPEAILEHFTSHSGRELILRAVSVR